MTKARCNPLWQPIPCPLSDIEGLESWLGDMAAQGLVPVTIGQNFARFRCSQPKAVRYRLNAKPAPETFLESAPGTPDGEERALAQECGWYYVTAVGDFFLYACEDSDAPELNTDPQVQALSLRYAKRQVFAPRRAAGLLAGNVLGAVRHGRLAHAGDRLCGAGLAELLLSGAIGRRAGQRGT